MLTILAVVILAWLLVRTEAKWTTQVLEWMQDAVRTVEP